MSGLDGALDISLEVGELIQLSGGHTTRTIDSMQRMAAALGAEESHVAVSSVNVSMTVAANGQKQTAGRTAGHFGINFSVLTQIERLVAETEVGGLQPPEIRARLAKIRTTGRSYRAPLVMAALGGSSAAFAVLFGASATGALLAFLGGWAGGWVRHLLMARGLQIFVPVASAAFVSAVIVAAGSHAASVVPVTPALAASTLFLVPGVPLLNGTADLLTGHYLNGLVKLALSAVIIISAALGLSAAVGLTGMLP